MAMKMSPAKTIEEYLKALPEDIRMTLDKLYKAIKSAAPNAEEVISYGMPAFKHYGMLVYFAAFKDHCSFFPGSAQIVQLHDELKSFKTSKGTIQFNVDKPLPVALVKKIVRARMEENEARQSARIVSKTAVKKTARAASKISKPGKLTEEAQVSEYMSKLKGEHKKEIEVVRKLIKKANSKLNERIKWNAPSYYYKQDIVTFGPYKTHKLLLVFHHPAVVKVKSGLLQGDYKDRRLVYFKDSTEAEKNKKELARIINEIIKQIDNSI
jgi:uncharacterized protein YdhG (YjbR/CyaY superfamily)